MTKNVVVLTVFLTLAAADNLVQFREGNRQFSADVYKQALAQKQNNFLVCPFSAETILALALNGAKGDTYEEIKNALHFPDAIEDTNEIFKNLSTQITKDGDYKLKTANKIYVTKKYGLRSKFGQVASKIYHSAAQNVDFSNNKKTARTINKWVSRKTQNKIKNLISPKSLNGDTVAVLVNALYFRGSWRKNFKKTLTQKRDFYKTPEDVTQVETMKTTDYYGYYEDENAKFLQIPFRNATDVHMVFVLPHQKDGLAQIEDRVDEVYKISNFKWEHVMVTLPKFRIESSLDFKTILKNLGVKHAFSDADFSGMGGGKGQIYISEVLQKTFISVNEDGVEAAASTAVLFHAKSLMDVWGAQRTFTADHPFMFYVKIQDLVIFTGRVVSPEV